MAAGVYFLNVEYSLFCRLFDFVTELKQGFVCIAFVCICNIDIRNLYVILVHQQMRLLVTLLVTEIRLCFRKHLPENIPLKLIHLV
jgi:predicted nuclease of restriction endonuclease-like (RecB) superfamily